MQSLNKGYRSQAMCNNFINVYGGKSKGTSMNDLYGFLHRHPKKEADTNLDSEHVIVDKKDWEILREFQKYTKAYDLCREMAVAFILKKGNIKKSDSIAYFNMANEITHGGKLYNDIDALTAMDKTRCDMDLPER